MKLMYQLFFPRLQRCYQQKREMSEFILKRKKKLQTLFVMELG